MLMSLSLVDVLFTFRHSDCIISKRELWVETCLMSVKKACANSLREPFSTNTFIQVTLVLTLKFLSFGKPWPTPSLDKNRPMCVMRERDNEREIERETERQRKTETERHRKNIQTKILKVKM